MSELNPPVVESENNVDSQAVPESELELGIGARISRYWTPYRLANATFLVLFLAADISLFLFGRESTNNIFLALTITLLSGAGALLWKRQRDNEKSNGTQRGIALAMIILHGLAAVIFTAGNFGRGGWEALANNIKIDGQLASDVVNYIVIIEKIFIWSIGIMLAADLIALFIFMEQDTEKKFARKLEKIARETEEARINAREKQAQITNTEFKKHAPLLAEYEGLVDLENQIRRQYGGRIPAAALNNMLADVQLRKLQLEGAIPVSVGNHQTKPANTANTNEEEAPFTQPSPQAPVS
jgi:LPXTG-motif cell wall-anchored protein